MPTPDEQPIAKVVAWSWRDLQVEPDFASNEEPQAPGIGAHWFHSETLCLCVWDGDSWEPVHPD